MRALIIIPARLNSKAIPEKNMKLFCGKPLIYWAINVALESDIGTVCVSTDCEKIRNYALSLGAEAPFLRPDILAMDDTPTEPVLIHALKHYATKSKAHSNLILLQPTSPFRKSADIIDAYKALTDNGDVTSVFSVRRAIANSNPDWMIVRSDDNKLTKFNGESLLKMNTRRQDLPEVFIRNDYVYALKSRNLTFDRTPNLYGRNPQLLISDDDRIDIDINTPIDWVMAETLFEREINDRKNKPII